MEILTQNPKKKWKLQLPKKKMWIIVGGMIAILVIVFTIFLYQLKKEVDALAFIQMKEKTLEETKTVTGGVISQDTVNIYPSKGMIANVFVKNDQEVAEGEALFAYDDTELQIQLKEAEAMKQATSSQYEALTNQITAIEGQINSYQTNSYQTDMLTPNIEDEEETPTDSSSSMESFLLIQTLQTQLIEIQAKQREAQIDIEKYQSQIDSLQKQIENLTVHSNAAGVVQNISDKLGIGLEITPEKQRTPILQIVSPTFLVEGKLTQEERARVQVGQVVEVITNMMPDQKWEGTISEVSNYPIEEDGNRYYRYQVTLGSQDNIYPGYEVDVTITVNSIEAMALPTNSIKMEGDIAYVFVTKNDQLTKRKVKLGMEANGWVEIKDGLKEQEKIVENPSNVMEIFFVR